MDSRMSNEYQQNRTGEIYGSVIILTVIAVTAVVLRFLARKISSAGFWWDDWTITTALISYLGFTTCYWVKARHYQLGRHTIRAGGPVDQITVEGFYKLCLAQYILYFVTSMAFKTSLILLYYRIFGVARRFRYTLATAECIVASYFLACVLVTAFECRPISYNWDKSIPGACINQTQFYRWNGVANLLIDFMILSLTFPMVWRLKIAFRQKVTLSSLFLLGTFVCVASIVRVTTFEQLNIEDPTYTIVTPDIWSATEQSLGITCACLPTLRPLFGRIFFGGTNASGSETLNNGESGEIRLSALSRKPAIRRSLGDESARGFAHLDEENVPSNSITSYAATVSRNDEGVMPKAVLRTQIVEQHGDNIERV